MADDELKVLHNRTNHEDNLHINRTSVFLNFNGFMAVAVGLTGHSKVQWGTARFFANAVEGVSVRV